MGGKGITRKWTKEESAIILSGKTVPGYEGHHEKNVADNPEEQANPDNIVFYSHEEHLKEHNGSFKNPTDGKLINKEKKLQKTNTKRNVKNELTGAANATVPNVVKGFINGCIDSTEKNSTIKDAIKSGCKSALKSGGKALVDYGFTRLLKQ